MKKEFQKHRYLVDYTLSSLLRRKAKNMSLLFIYTLIVFLFSSVLLFSLALKKEAAAVLKNAPEITLQRQVAGRHALMPGHYLEDLGRIRGVTRKQLRLWGYYYDAGIKANYTLMVPEEQMVTEGEIIVGSALAKARALTPGFFYKLSAADGSMVDLTIKEVISPESDLVSADLMLISEPDFRRVFAVQDDMYTDITLDVANSREVINIANKIAARLPDVRPILKAEILRTYDAVFDFRQGIVMVVLSGSVLAFFILAWEKASGLSGEEKREIGILKAVGWETSDILKMKFWEGAIISMTAFFLGYLLAFLHLLKGASFVFEPVLKGWATLYPEFSLTPRLDGFQAATLFFFTVFPYVTATIIPVWRAAVIDPAEVMR